jgi:hypothetical protein
MLEIIGKDLLLQNGDIYEILLIKIREIYHYSLFKFFKINFFDKLF